MSVLCLTYISYIFEHTSIYLYPTYIEHILNINFSLPCSFSSVNSGLTPSYMQLFQVG